jgi:hypothetical protein
MLLPASVAPAARGRGRGRTTTTGTTTTKPRVKGRTNCTPTLTNNNNFSTKFTPVAFGDNYSNVSNIGIGMGVAIGGSAVLHNPIPINPYKKQSSQHSSNHTSNQAATTAELLSYFDKVLLDVSEKDSTETSQAAKQVASTKKPSSKKGKKTTSRVDDS